MADSPRKPGVLQRFSKAIEGTMQSGFYKLGYAIAGRPVITILISLAVTAAFGAGMATFTSENRSEKLWVPQDSIAQAHRQFFDATFNGQTRLERLFHDALVALTAEADGQTETLNTICVKIGGVCQKSSPLDLWLYDYSAAKASASDAQASLLQAVNRPNPQQQTGGPLRLDAVLGGITRNSTGGITGATALQFTYYVRDQAVVINGEEVDKAAEAWENKAIDVGLAFSSSSFDVRVNTVVSSSNEFGAAIQGDVSLLSIGYILIIGYACIMLGRLTCVEARVWIALGAVAAVGLAIAASFGLSSLIGEFYGPIHSVLPFLLLGLGIDDAFIITSEFDRTPSTLPVRERIAHALSHAGVSITITSITDVVAFGIGSSTILPALSSFCIYAAIGVMFDFLFQVTFFVACLTIDSRRVAKGRGLCCCCCNRKPLSPRSIEVNVGQINSPIATAASTGTVKTVPSARSVETQHVQVANNSHFGYLERFFQHVLGPVLSFRWVQAVVVVVFVGMLAVGITGATQLETEFSELSFIPDDSYLQAYFAARNKYFPSSDSVSIVMRPDNGYLANDAQVIALQASVAPSPLFAAGSFKSWHTGYMDWLRNRSPHQSSLVGTPALPPSEELYRTWLSEYIAGEGTRFARDVAFSRNSTGGVDGIKGTRFEAEFVSLDTVSEQTGAMTGLRDLVKANSGALNAFPFTYQFIEWELFLVVQDELYQNVGLSLLAVFIITLALIAHPGTSLLVFLSIGMTIADLLGLMWIWGVDIDGVAVINLVLAIGLAVDYSAHIGHSFMLKTGTRIERMKATLTDMGAPVFNGAFSTFLAVVVLAFSKSFVFRVFFKQFFGIVLFGMLHGLVFLPVVLSLIGPEPYQTADSSEYEEPVKTVEMGALAGNPPATATEAVDKKVPATV